MMLLPEGFALPPAEYVFALVIAAILVTTVLVAVDPPIDQRLAVGLAPWMCVGGALHAFYQLQLYPGVWEPLFGAPAVYVTLYVLAGTIWAAFGLYETIAGHPERIARDVGVVGVGVLTVLFVAAARAVWGAGTLEPIWPAIALVVSIVATVLTVVGVALWRTPLFLKARYVGPTVIFAHALDGVTTAIGADVLGVRERSPVPRAILEFAGGLPTAESIGTGWLFLLVKLIVAAAIVLWFADYVEEEPAQATLLLSIVAAVGLGPATNNLFLFLVGAP